MNMRQLGSVALVLIALPAAAQQAGAIVGKVAMKDGKGLAGVRIEATSNVLPQPRRVVSGETGDFRMPFLPPGDYVLTFTHPSKATEKRGVSVALQQNTSVNVAMADAAIAGAQVEVVAQASMMDPASAELKTSITSDVINSLPTGQSYRDLVKLIPGVQYSQDTTRSPSAGGSGQDNVHMFDGVNVNLPLFGTMSAEPSSHDVDQIAISKGGADATGFNRSAGYSINSISKSGTNAFTGELSYQWLPTSLFERRVSPTAAKYEQEQDYTVANVGGPIVKERLFFFASYYRPTASRKNGTNLYGAAPDYKSTRDEFFGKLTYAPTTNLLIHGSYRTSDKTETASTIPLATVAPTTLAGSKIKMDIATLEASWAITPSSFLNFKATDFTLKTQDRPDYISSAVPALDGTATLNVGALATQGLFFVPAPRVGTTAPILAYNAFIQPLINQYGYIGPTTGLPTGGGTVGGASQFNNQDFYRQSYQLAYDATFGSSVTHEVHVGYQWSKEWEDLLRTSNGWGSITAPYNVPVPVGLPNAGAPIIFQAAVQQQGILGVPTLRSEYVSQTIEVNDKIKWRNFTFNVGVMISNDKLYGQGLRENPGTLSGYELAPGNKYLEKEIKFSETLQPRLGVTWNYHAEDTVYANYARYVPAVSSLPRAASWARNKAATVNVYFDAAGNMLASQVEASSTGKLFTPGMDPRHTDEVLIGTTRDLGHGWNGRLYSRYRKSVNFWEDTNNNARLLYQPPAGIPRTLYIPNLGNMLLPLYPAASASGANDGAFVIAQLDNAFTKYYEVGLESEWRGTNAYLRASYVWSHYYGNFDQDNSTTAAANDFNIFVGSSNLADDPGRQVWDNKYGNLTGDRRHQVKVFGYYELPWEGRIGAYFIFQSGQPWQRTSYEPYIPILTAIGSTSTSDVNRYAEPAGSRVGSSHWQLDLNYTQAFWKRKAMRLDGMVDIYNLFDRQTGYNPITSVHSTLMGVPQSFYLPRRVQLGVKFLF
ncbi:MAG: carboxypeptidase regulatory-like domain-containing protein [Geothrix sp.]|nr:carboxypeptidase regulatory-like domain-containing protein [Geothrix sp.]